LLIIAVMETKYTICDICGESVKARGIGGHKALKHGIVVKTVVRDKSTRVHDTSNNSSTPVNNTSTHSSNTSTPVINTSTRVQRPSDYVKKRSEVVTTEVKPSIVSPDSLGRMLCKNCGCWFMPESWFEMKGYSNPYPYCTNGKKHELI
jgi:hypothetical protein